MADNRSTEDGPLIKIIKDAGAIIIVRGNISQVRLINLNFLGGIINAFRK